MNTSGNKFTAIAIITVIALMLPQLALATGTSGMPWETWLDTFLKAITGPIARTVGLIVLIAAGFSLAMGEMGAGAKKLVQVCFGLSIAFAATSWGLPFLGFAGGAVI